MGVHILTAFIGITNCFNDLQNLILTGKGSRVAPE